MRNALIHISQKLEKTSKEYILVHSDLSLSNILLTQRGLAIIDFSLLGYSNALLDFGSLYCFIDHYEQQAAVISGYQQSTGIEVEEAMIQNYKALQILLGIAIHFDIWKKEEWFPLKLEQWCEIQFTPLWKT